MAGHSRARRKRGNKAKSKACKTEPEPLSDDVAEEITALSAILQEDFSLVSEHPIVEFSITIRPYPEEDGVQSDVSFRLLVRCLPGYPNKPPKLQLLSEDGHLEEQRQSLHSMLVEQAASIARQGRVMVYNLVETAKEFLSEHRVQKPQEGGCSPTLAPESWDTEPQGSPSEPLNYFPRSEDHVCLDLFDDGWGEADEHWDYQFPIESSAQLTKPNPFIRDRHQVTGQRNLTEREATEFVQRPQRAINVPVDVGLAQQNALQDLAGELALKDKEDVIDEGLEVQLDRKAEQHIMQGHQNTLSAGKGKASHLTSVLESLVKIYPGLFGMASAAMIQSVGHLQQPVHSENYIVADNVADKGDEEFRLLEDRMAHPPPLTDATLHSLQKDFMLGHLLRLVCGPKGPLPYMLSVLASQFEKLGVMPWWVKELLTAPSPVFDITFRKLFIRDMLESDHNPDPLTEVAVANFWSASPELLGEGNSAHSANSRYVSDFEELKLLGRGGFGHVVLCVNKLDGRRYAMKKIQLKDKRSAANNKILREVATLSRLQHHNVVRYYQAWFETGVGQSLGRINGSSREFESSGLFSEVSNETIAQKTGKEPEVTTLYIQMEFCPRTLREVLDVSMSKFDKEEIWRMFRQIVEGLVHIHGQGIIHRDLTPNNIFFDARNEIKIGDFGLAKFSTLEQPDNDISSGFASELAGTSVDGTGQVGTYFYTAPEIEQRWPHIDEKVDMYSLGVVLFEMWYPFGTSMERYLLLTDLKHNGVLPASWSAEFVQQCTLVKWLLTPDPCQRPSAMQVLRSELLPPRMEDESLNDILRTIQGGEESVVYDQVVAAIFDDERIAAEADRLNEELIKHKKRAAHSSIHAVSGQDQILEGVRDVFVRHGAQHLESTYMSAAVDGLYLNDRRSLKLMESSGTMLHVRYETRSCFAQWVAANQQTSLKRYEIGRVARRGVGRSAPQEYYQGDFDIVGGARTLAEAEVIKVTLEVVSKCPSFDSCEVHVNHRALLDAIWNWAGVKQEEKRVVAQIFAVTAGIEPRSPERKSLWTQLRRQLQALQLGTVTIDRLQTVERRLIGNANEALARLRGALPPNPQTLAALNELTTLLTYLEVWRIEENITIDALMAPSEEFLDGIFFQIHVRKIVPPGPTSRGAMSSTCIAHGGRYDQLIQRDWAITTSGPSIPGAVGVSIALQKLIWASPRESKSEPTSDVLVCSRGGGGLLHERMELVAELWDGGIKAEYVLSVAPSLTEQYEYAHEHGIRYLVIVTERGIRSLGLVQVRFLDSRMEVDVPKEDLVKYITENLVNKSKRNTGGKHGSQGVRHPTRVHPSTSES